MSIHMVADIFRLVDCKEDTTLVWAASAGKVIGIFVMLVVATDKHFRMLESKANQMVYFESFAAVEDIVHMMRVEFADDFELVFYIEHIIRLVPSYGKDSSVGTILLVAVDIVEVDNLAVEY